MIEWFVANILSVAIMFSAGFLAGAFWHSRGEQHDGPDPYREPWQ